MPYKKTLKHEDPVDYLCDGPEPGGITCGTTITLYHNPGENTLLCPACRVKREQRQRDIASAGRFVHGRCGVITNRGTQCMKPAAGPDAARCNVHRYELYAKAATIAA